MLTGEHINDDHTLALIARWMGIALLPIVLGTVFWIASTVNDSAQKITSLTQSIDALNKQMDLKFQIRDDRLGAIECQLDAMVSRLDAAAIVNRDIQDRDKR